MLSKIVTTCAALEIRTSVSRIIPWPLSDQHVLVCCLPLTSPPRSKVHHQHEGGWKACASPCLHRCTPISRTAQKLTGIFGANFIEKRLGDYDKMHGLRPAVTKRSGRRTSDVLKNSSRNKIDTAPVSAPPTPPSNLSAVMTTPPRPQPASTPNPGAYSTRRQSSHRFVRHA